MFDGLIKSDEIKAVSEDNEIVKFPVDGIEISELMNTVLSIEFSNGEFIKVKYNIKGDSETRELVNYLNSVIADALNRKKKL